MQDSNESNYKIDFDILISIEPYKDEIMYYSKFYNKKMVMKHFAWLRDVDNTKNFEEYVKVWYLNFDEVPFTIDGKKCMMPNKHFQYEATGKIVPIPNIQDICQYLNTREVYVKDMTQNDFQSYLADYLLFPFFEKDRIAQKENLFEEIFEAEARVRLRENGIVLDIEGFADFIQTTRKDIEKLTGEAFKEVVIDYYFLKSNNQKTPPLNAVQDVSSIDAKNNIPLVQAEGKKEYKLIKNATLKETTIINAFNQEMAKSRMTQATALNLLSRKTDLGVGGEAPKNRKKQIHDTLKLFGLALKK